MNKLLYDLPCTKTHRKLTLIENKGKHLRKRVALSATFAKQSLRELQLESVLIL